jgi:AcrR family transcriptional regulator
LTQRYTLLRIPVQPKLLPRAERRASILRGAAAAFAESGFAHTSMEDVAGACGVTKLIVYRHFGTKEELYRAILQGVFDRLGEELQAGLATRPPHRGVGARTQLTVAREDPDAYTLLWRHAAREPMFAAYAASMRDLSIDVVRQLLHLDTGDAVIDRWKAETLFSFLVDATLAWIDNGDPTRDGDFVEHTTTGFWALLDTWRT